MTTLFKANKQMTHDKKLLLFLVKIDDRAVILEEQEEENDDETSSSGSRETKMWQHISTGKTSGWLPAENVDEITQPLFLMETPRTAWPKHGKRIADWRRDKSVVKKWDGMTSKTEVVTTFPCFTTQSYT